MVPGVGRDLPLACSQRARERKTRMREPRPVRGRHIRPRHTHFGRAKKDEAAPAFAKATAGKSCAINRRRLIDFDRPRLFRSSHWHRDTSVGLIGRDFCPFQPPAQATTCAPSWYGVEWQAPP